MSTPIRLQRSAVSGKRPTVDPIQLGELALNFWDGKLFVKREDNFGQNVVEIGNLLSRVEVTGISTLTGRIINEDGARFGNVRLSITDNVIDTTTGDLNLTPESGIVNVSDKLNVVGIATVQSHFNVTGDNATINRVIIGGTETPNEINTVGGENLILDSGGGQTVVRDTLYVTGISTHLVGSQINGVSIGLNDSPNTITTLNSALILDGGGNLVNVDSNLTVSGFSTFTSTADFNDGVFIDNIEISTTDDNTNRITTSSDFLQITSADNLVLLTNTRVTDRNTFIIGDGSEFTEYKRDTDAGYITDNGSGDLNIRSNEGDINFISSGANNPASLTVNSAGILLSSVSNPNLSTIAGPEEIHIDPAGIGDNTGTVRIKGDLIVDGEQFIVDSSRIELADFNVGIASTVATNTLLDGAGIGIGSENIRKNLTYDYSSDALKSSENFDVAEGKV